MMLTFSATCPIRMPASLRNPPAKCHPKRKGVCAYFVFAAATHENLAGCFLSVDALCLALPCSDSRVFVGQLRALQEAKNNLLFRVSQSSCPPAKGILKFMQNQSKPERLLTEATFEVPVSRIERNYALDSLRVSPVRCIQI